MLILLFLVIIMLAFYFYGKWYAHNASVKGLPYTPPQKYREPGDTKREKTYSSVPPGPPPPPPPPLPSSQDKGEKGLARDKDVSLHPIFADYVITYCDRNGLTTERRITIQRIEGDLIQAYCHLRHDRRSFYASRTSKWINCNSGEIVADIFEDLLKARKKSVYGVIDRMSEDLYPAMGVLLYLCKGDKRLMIGERNILIKAFYLLCDDTRLTDEAINDGINEMTVPSRTRYMNLTRQISTMGREVQSIVLESAKEIFAPRKQLNPIEKEAMSELEKRLIGKQ